MLLPQLLTTAEGALGQLCTVESDAASGRFTLRTGVPLEAAAQPSERGGTQEASQAEAGPSLESTMDALTVSLARNAVLNAQLQCSSAAYAWGLGMEDKTELVAEEILRCCVPCSLWRRHVCVAGQCQGHLALALPPCNPAGADG